MPGTTKKGLYLAKNMTELNKLAADKPQVNNARIIVKSIEKVFRAAEQANVDGDEERAYVLYMKYFNILQTVKKSAEYKKNEKYFKEMISARNTSRAIDQAEVLAKSLKNRYDETEAEEVSKKLENIRIEGEKRAEEKEKLEQEEKEKEKEEEEKRKETENGKAEKPVPPPGVLSCSEMYHLMIDGSAPNLLVMDLRSEAEYNESHIKHKSCISVPQEIINPGTTVRHIEKGLPEESREAWLLRSSADHIILYDWTSSNASLQTGTKLKSLKDAIFKFDQTVIVKSEPLVLDGGYDAWMMFYPMYTTNINIKKPKNLQPKIPQNVPSLDTIVYDLDLNFLKDPEEERRKKEEEERKQRLEQEKIALNNARLSQNKSSIPSIDRSSKPKLNNMSANDLTSFSQDKNRNTTYDVNSKVNNISSLQNLTRKESNIEKEMKMEAKQPTVNRSLKPRTTGNGNQVPPGGEDVSEEEWLRLHQETEAKQAALYRFREENLRLVAEHKARTARLKEDERQLDLLAKMKKREVAETAQLMREKKRIQEELKELEKDKAKWDAEDNQRETEVNSLKQEELEKMKRMEDVARLRAERKRQEMDLKAKEEQVRQLQQKENEEKLAREKIEKEQASILSQQKLEEEEKKKLDEEKKKEEERKAEEARLAEIKRKEEEAKAAEEAKKAKEQAKILEEEIKIQESKKREEARKQEEARKLEEKRKAQAQREEEARKIEEKRLEEAKKAAERKRWEMERKAAEDAASRGLTTKDPEFQSRRQNLPEGWQKVLDKSTGRYMYIDIANQVAYPHPPEPVQPTRPQPEVYKTRLKDESEQSSGGGGMKRSHSSPNIAKMLQDEDAPSPSPQPVPTVDRTRKPKPPSYLHPTGTLRTEVAAAKVRNLQPTWGNVTSGLTGLRNMGNTCYMNSTLQCLSNTTLLASYFLTDNYKSDINRENFLGSGGEIAEEFAVVVKALWSGQYRSITPRDFKTSMARFNPMFAGYDQQDSQELLLSLMDGLHEDLNKVQRRPKLPEQNNDRLSDEEAAKLAWNHHKLINNSVIVELFQGLFKSTIMCMSCRKSSVTFDAFMYLSLPIPSSASRCTLHDCLQNFSKEEKMTGDSRWQCPQCRCKRDAVKYMVIWKLPPILLIHLKRFYYQGMWREKINTYVDFPLEGLDMKRYIQGTPVKSAYSLYGVSNHYGTMEGGHYTAYCKSPTTSRWYKYDDHEVYEYSQSDIKTSAAYILFYTSVHRDIRIT